MKTLKYSMLLVFLTLAFQLKAQTDEATTKRIVEARNFIFKATAAMPMASADINAVLSRMPGNSGGGVINLNGSQYDLIVTRDSIEAYLPYFGRSYVPQMSPDDAGIKFKSKDFSYKSSNRKKGWLIKIEPKDIKDRQNMTLTITQNGYATLSINNNNKQPITFNGYLEETKAEKD